MRLWICAAAVNGFVAVALGAYAAHGAGVGLAPEAVEWLRIGARYGAVHALALLAVAALAGGAAPGGAVVGARWLRLAGWGFLLGTVLFSGLLYGLGLTGWRPLGAVVPLGGLSFLVGWVALFAYGLGLRRAVGARGSA